MTMHYHGGPITPASELMRLTGRCFCVSFAAPSQVKRVHEIGQSVLLDNGAFTFWRGGKEPDWHAYYEWCEPWLDFCTTWAVIPDVIDGSEEDNDRLLNEWSLPHGAPVWHMHESINRLQHLCHWYERVCIGSSGQYATLGTPQWHHRMEQAMNAVCGSGSPSTWLHMLRGMEWCQGPYPFASVDSSDIAQNHHRPQNNVVDMALRWDSMQAPARWTPREQLALEGAA